MIDQASASGQVPAARAAKKKPPEVPTTLEAEDVQDLRAYCKDDGFYMPTHSTFSAQLLRAELQSKGCTGCRRCGGSKVRTGRGFIPTDDALPPRRRRRQDKGKRLKKPSAAENYRRALERFRRKEARRLGWMITATTAQRDALRVRGNEAFTRAELAAFYDHLPELFLKLCPNCKGVGTVPRETKGRATKPLTARPTGSSKQPAEGGGAEMDEEGLHRRGKTDRRLAEVRKRIGKMPKAAAFLRPINAEDHDPGRGVLQTYFQPGNETLKSLWRFTKHGRMLLDTPNPNHLTERARITALLDAVHVSKDRQKQGWIDLADKEAQDLLDLYCRTWNTVVAELVQRSAKDLNGAKLKVGATVLIFEGGKRQHGRIEAQAREFWKVRITGDSLREVAGWHLERVA
ncbi:MAG TPA: hypothetical protein VJN18_32200 [Polyangiaceae bacterium]|nr:hypothetical protein [Polyangiaceae bacterium]